MIPTRLAVLCSFVCLTILVEKSVLGAQEGDIRLVGSTDPWQGRVEIYHNKTWGTICDDYWDITYAKVVCRQLHYQGALEVYMAADFGMGTGPIHLDRLRCNGNESKITDCDTKGWNHGYCKHDEDVGVACLHSSATPSSGCTFDVDWCNYENLKDDDFDWLRQTKRTPSYDTGPAHDHTTGNGSYVYIETSRPRVQGEMARFRSPPFTDVKCIEFYYIMKGKSVNELSVYIDDGLEMKAAWQLKGENRTWQMARFPVPNLGSVRIVFEGLVGTSYQGDIAIDDITAKKSSCQLIPSNAKPEPIDLSHINSTLRLVNGNVSSAGRIEILHKGRWGTICGSHFHLTAATVVCRQLGYLDVETLVPCCLFGSGKGMIWLDNLHCEGREPTVTMCSHKGWGKTSCAHSRDVGVICKTKNTLRDIRLAGTYNEWEGRVEVKVGGIWGTVMDYGWDIFDATVFCRQLRYAGATSAYSSAHYGEGTGPIWFSRVLCQGNETELWKCNMTQHQIQWKPHWWWHWSVHKRDASAECYDLRLAGGKTSMEGRLEMRHLGVWGTVCKEGWDMNAAIVACRNLGFSRVVSMEVSYKIKPTDDVDPIVSRYKCKGDEPVLGLCSYDPLSAGKHSCTHDHDVTIVCDSRVVQPTSGPVRKGCKQGCPKGTCYKSIKHGGFCMCNYGDPDPSCDSSEDKVVEATFAKITLSQFDTTTFRTNLRDQLNQYCSSEKKCSQVTNGTKFEKEDITILDGWPKTVYSKLIIKFAVLVPTQYSRSIISSDVITKLASKQNNQIGGYDVLMANKPISPSSKAKKSASDTVKVVVPIVVVLVIVGIAVVVYIVYKKRSAFGAGVGGGPSSQRYLHLSPDDHHDQDDPLLSMEDDDAAPTSVRA